ncbi:MAG TPA: ABC transporter ATP-binding protein [Anaerolineae bacterium]|nr:ABC transporter ATP-binding protein [Anaerolineae bacterium]
MFRHGHGRGLAQEKERADDAVGTLRRLLRYFRPFTWALLIVGVLLVLGSLIEVAVPYLLQIAVDQFIVPQGTPPPVWLAWLIPSGIGLLPGLARLMLFLLGIYVLRWLMMSTQFLMMNVVGQKVLLKMRTEILERIHALSLKFFDEREAGDLMSRLVNDTQVINQVFSGGIVRLLSVSLSLFGIVVAMVSLRWDLALASFAILPLMIFATSAFARRARKAFRRTRETIGDVSSELQENIAGVREVQAFARERTNVAEFRQVNRANRDANVQAQTLTSAFSPALDVLSTAALALVLGYGGWLVVRGSATIGLIVAYMTYVQRFYRPIQMISSLWTQFQSAVAGAERIFELVDTKPEVVDAPEAVELPPIQGRVVFEHVDFGYKPEEPVLRDISLEAEPGQTVALVGPTGAGKTSVVSLLMRFYDVIDGRITVDGYDIRDVMQASLRQQMGVVLQDTFLFSTSVMENIRYGRLDATDEEVMEAARLANAHDFIMHMPEAYQTNIGERGSNLSQGQRQLFSIARAILCNPRILILDEATSSVDTRTELLIQAALDKLLRGRTSFVIAHRLSTIRGADKVLVLEEGEIVERGTHTSLMAARGKYYDLYMSQFRRETDEEEEERQPVPAGVDADVRGDGQRLSG